MASKGLLNNRIGPATVIAWLLVLMTAAWGCGVAAERPSAMERMHSQARALERGGDMEAALLLYAAAARATPPGATTAAQQQALRQDSLFALGRGQLALARPQEALVTARRGLGLGRAETVFVANLLALEATALEALGRSLEAVAVFEEALGIHEALLARAIGRREVQQ